MIPDGLVTFAGPEIELMFYLFSPIFDDEDE